MSLTTQTKQIKKSNLVQVRVDEQTKFELEKVLEKLGLTTSQAILMYIKQIVMKKKIPFELSTTPEYEDRELSQEEFNRLQAYIISQLDKGEEIPEFHEKNTRPFNF